MLCPILNWRMKNLSVSLGPVGVWIKIQIFRLNSFADFNLLVIHSVYIILKLNQVNSTSKIDTTKGINKLSVPRELISSVRVAIIAIRTEIAKIFKIVK